MYGEANVDVNGIGQLQRQITEAATGAAALNDKPLSGRTYTAVMSCVCQVDD
jgi:X-X-X-Leu-X-X-Gly heptad repeat protein